MKHHNQSPEDRRSEIRLSGRKPPAPRPKPFDPGAVKVVKKLDLLPDQWQDWTAKITDREVRLAHKDPEALKAVFRYKMQGGTYAPDVLVRKSGQGRYRVSIRSRLLGLIPYTVVWIVDDNGDPIGAKSTLWGSSNPLTPTP